MYTLFSDRIKIPENIRFVAYWSFQVYSNQLVTGTSTDVGTFSNEDGNTTNDDGSEKSHFWLALFFYVPAQY